MFTGLIEATGTLLEAKRHATGPIRVVFFAPSIAPRLKTGDSVAVSGVCLTALDLSATTFSADLAEETIARTTLSRLVAGDTVNLELPTPAGSPLGGHVVQGHVDGVGMVLAIDPIDPANRAATDWRMTFRAPSTLGKFIAPQGSITVDGISLTVAAVDGDTVSIAVIPHTYARTTISKLHPGTPINIEVDILAKYAERQFVSSSRWTVTEEYLLANGY